MCKHDTVRRVPAKASIEAVLNIISVIVGILDALYTLIMKLIVGGTD